MARESRLRMLLRHQLERPKGLLGHYVQKDRSQIRLETLSSTYDDNREIRVSRLRSMYYCSTGVQTPLVMGSNHAEILFLSCR